MTEKQHAEKAARSRLAIRLGIPEPWLLTVFTIESGNVPSRVNNTTGATGLIQFMPATAAGMGTTVYALGKMNYEDQLEWVYKYLYPYRTRIKSLADLYLTIFYPYAVGKPESYILGSERNMAFSHAIFSQNPGFRNPKNQNKGYYTKADITQYVENYAKRLGVSTGPKTSKLITSIANLFKKLFS